MFVVVVSFDFKLDVVELHFSSPFHVSCTLHGSSCVFAYESRRESSAAQQRLWRSRDECCVCCFYFSCFSVFFVYIFLMLEVIETHSHEYIYLIIYIYIFITLTRYLIFSLFLRHIIFADHFFSSARWCCYCCHCFCQAM